MEMNGVDFINEYDSVNGRLAELKTAARVLQDSHLDFAKSILMERATAYEQRIGKLKRATVTCEL